MNWVEILLPYVLTISILIVLHVIDRRDRRHSFARLAPASHPNSRPVTSTVDRPAA
jgi:hypothetical protein